MSTVTLVLSGQAPAGLGRSEPGLGLYRGVCIKSEFRASYLSPNNPKRWYWDVRIDEQLRNDGRDSSANCVGLEITANQALPMDASDAAKTQEAYFKQVLVAFNLGDRDSIQKLTGNTNFDTDKIVNRSAYFYFEPSVAGMQDSFPNITWLNEDDAFAIRDGKRTVKLRNTQRVAATGGASIGSGGANIGDAVGSVTADPPIGSNGAGVTNVRDETPQSDAIAAVIG